MKRLIYALFGALCLAGPAKADIADGKFSTNQIFDVQYNWSGTTLNASNFIAPYDQNFTHPTVAAGDYFQFFNSTTNPGTYGLGLYTSAGALKQVVHDTGTLQAIGPGALFYIGSGFFGTVISTGEGYSYGQSGTFANMNTSPTASDFTGYTWASATPLAAGQTAAAPYPVNTQALDTGVMNGWTTGGGTGAQTSTAYTSVGKGVALVQEMTSYVASGSTYSWTVKPPTGKWMFSIQPTNQKTVNVNDFDKMVSDLGLSAASKSEIIAAMSASGNGPPTNAAWVYQDITLSNGQTFKMAWQYISTDYEPYNDGSLTSLVNRTGTVVAKVNGADKEYALLGFTNKGTGNYSVGSYGATGWQLSEYVANEAGTYRLGFAAFNLSDTSLSPILFVSKDIGTTFNFGVPFLAIAPNAGSSAPNNSSGPTIVSTAAGPSVITSSTAAGVPVVTNVTNTNLVNGVDGQGNPIVTTYYTVTTTTQTPNTITTTTTPVTITTYSDGSTTSTNGTPTTVTTSSTTTSTNTTAPAIQSVATSVTTPGTAATTSSVVHWPSSSTTTITYTKMPMTSKLLTINKNTVVVVAQPSTTTNVTTTPVITTTTTVDGSGNQLGQTDSTVNQVVTNTVDDTLYSASSTNAKDSVNAMAIKDAIAYSRNNPFIVDVLSTKDGPWAMPSVYRANINGKLTGKDIKAGYQSTTDNNTVGFAFSGGEGDGSGYLNSKMNYQSYAATGYLLSKQDDFWIKASIGMSKGIYNSSNSLPLFAMNGNSKSAQTNIYGDLTVYGANTYYGFRPLAGVTIVNSKIGNATDTNGLLAVSPDKGTKTVINPYAGLRYEFNDNISLEARTTQTQDFGNVKSIKATVKQDVFENVSVNASISYAKGHNYTNTTGMVGLDWKF
jgi:hypothetical protein